MKQTRKNKLRQKLKKSLRKIKGGTGTTTPILPSYDNINRLFPYNIRRTSPDNPDIIPQPRELIEFRNEPEVDIENSTLKPIARRASKSSTEKTKGGKKTKKRKQTKKNKLRQKLKKSLKRIKGGGRKPVIKDQQKYKTVLCNNFLQNGWCPYGKKCQFAHGENELRRPETSLPSQITSQPSVPPPNKRDGLFLSHVIKPIQQLVE